MNVAVKRSALACAVAASLFAAPCAVLVAQEAPKTIPARLTDQEFWKMSQDLSEPVSRGFPSENLVSNEMGAQQVIPKLEMANIANRVYIGVGPDQNFAYMIATKAKMAIIIDIRNGNRLHHLLYKALLELSANRNEFIARLFSKPLTTSPVDTTATIDSLVNRYYKVYGDTGEYRKNRDAVWNHLTKTHGFPLTRPDSVDLYWIYDRFYEYGMAITYSSGDGNNGRGGRNMPQWAEIVTLTDGQRQRGFLANETNFRFMKDLESKNLIVPVFGDFGGPTAVAAVGKWVKDRNGLIGMIYTSNVEQYLWQQNYFDSYYKSAANFPVDSNSVFVRSGGGGMGRGIGYGMQGSNWICPVQRLITAYQAGQVSSYNAIFNLCN